VFRGEDLCAYGVCFGMSEPPIGVIKYLHASLNSDVTRGRIAEEP
jgi:hypothetical protein